MPTYQEERSTCFCNIENINIIISKSLGLPRARKCHNLTIVIMSKLCSKWALLGPSYLSQGLIPLCTPKCLTKKHPLHNSKLLGVKNLSLSQLCVPKKGPANPQRHSLFKVIMKTAGVLYRCHFF